MTFKAISRLSALPLLAIAIGCAAPPRAAPPAIWPPTWSGRQLFYTHGILVYSREGSSADDAAQLATDLAHDFTHRTAGQPAPGLLIVNDVEDSGIGNLKPDDLLTPPQKNAGLSGSGLSAQELAFSTPTAIDKEQLRSQTVFKEQALHTIDWAAAIPSDRRVEQLTSHAITAAMNKQNLNFAQRLLVLPFMPWMNSLAQDAIRAQRDLVIYKCFCNAQSNWDEARKRKEIDDYESQRMNSVLSTIGAATRQAAPATDTSAK